MKNRDEPEIASAHLDDVALQDGEELVRPMTRHHNGMRENFETTTPKPGEATARSNGAALRVALGKL